MINQIQSSLEKVDFILHIADIHIRNWKRHKEYKEVFNRLYHVVDNLPPNSLITVGGDIVHAKTDMSPELIHMVSSFFKQLADRAPTIVITGNHDTNLNNNSRLDALTPIVEANNHPNLFYLRDSGVYRVGDIDISVMSLLDTADKYVTADKIQSDCSKKVAMYHGTLVNSAVDSGMHMSHGLSWDTFAGFDLVLLGDIHKRQMLSEANPTMFYPGSLIQQSFGESFEGHGYALVRMRDLKVAMFDLPNQYGFFTVDIADGKLPANLPIGSKTNVRLKVKTTSPADLKNVLAELRKEYGVSDVVIHNHDKSSADSNLDGVDDTLYQADVRNPQVQRQLLKDYLKDAALDQDLLDRVFAINDTLNQQIPQSETARGIQWKPKMFEFDNMFSYGEGNRVDFENLNGTCGIFAPNHAGKSAILDALCFCLFDHTSRANKADQVLNNKSDWFKCKFNFELNGLDYFIEKRATRYQKGPLAGKLRVDIDFWYVNEDGDSISLNGEQRRDTDRIIQSYVGTYDDFVLTALSLQGNSSNFVEKTQAERKDLLANFLDLSIFDQLYELANKEVKASVTLLENYEKQDFDVILGDAQRSLQVHQAKLKEAEKLSKLEEQKLDEQNEELNELNKQLRPCKSDSLDINKLNNERRATATQIETLSTFIPKAKVEWETKAANLEKLENQYSELSTKFDRTAFDLYNSKVKESFELDRTMSSMKLVIQNKIDKLDKLKKHEYDPNCSYCVNNIFVKDALETETQLANDIAQATSLKQELDKVRQLIAANEHTKDEAATLEQLQQAKASRKKDVQLTENAYNTLLKDLDIANHKLDKIDADIQAYNDDLAAVESNKQIGVKIKELKDKIAQTRSNLNKYQIRYSESFADIQVDMFTIESAKNSIKHMRELSEKLTAYELYCNAVYKDGIPYLLISRAVPFIQNYVNNILAPVVDFTVSLETDGKNINVFIGYDGNKWPLELASGMERFISSLAIRIALIKTTNLPKPNFMAIDEGLGVLDSSNLNSMHMFFMYMKEVFKFSLIISHIDVVRDMVDTIITIDRKNDFSYINC